MERHAVYAICKRPVIDSRGRKAEEIVPFRVGLPVDLDTAQARWQRLDDRRYYGKRRQHVRWNRRKYLISAFEVRAVDQHGRGLGSLRHGLAFPVPYRSLRVEPR